MAFLQGIFGGKGGQGAPILQQGNQPAPQQGNQQANQPQPQGNQQPGQAPQGFNAGAQTQGPANSQFQGNGQNGGPANPMDAWLEKLTPQQQPNSQGQGGQQPQGQPQPQGLFGDSLSQENLQKVVGGANFTANLPQEKIQAALGGDTNAFMEVLNAQAQNVMMAAIRMNAGLVEHGVKTGNKQFEGSMDSRMRDFMISNKNVSRPELQHPLAKSMLDAMKKQFASANPTATPDDIHAMGEKFMGDFADFISGARKSADSQSNPGQQANKETDWLQSFMMDGEPGQQQQPQPQSQGFNF